MHAWAARTYVCSSACSATYVRAAVSIECTLAALYYGLLLYTIDRTCVATRSELSYVIYSEPIKIYQHIIMRRHILDILYVICLAEQRVALSVDDQVCLRLTLELGW